MTAGRRDRAGGRAGGDRPAACRDGPDGRARLGPAVAGVTGPAAGATGPTGGVTGPTGGVTGPDGGPPGGAGGAGGAGGR